MKTFKINIAETGDEKVPDQTLEKLDGMSPINTLGQLRHILKDLPDDTVICNGLVAMYPEGSKVEEISKARSHRILFVWKGLLKSGRTFICFMSGSDVSKAVLKDSRLKLDEQ